MPVTVLIVDDHELIRQGLQRVFEHSDDVAVVHEVGTVGAASAMLDAEPPDVVVLDTDLPDGDGLEVAAELRRRHPQLGIVLISKSASDDQLFGALDAGASAFVTQDATAAEVLAATRHAAASPLTFTAAHLADAMRRRLEPSGPQLSPREQEVLVLLADGLGVAQIAKRLHISESTTKSHVSKLYDKLDAGNRAQALMNALRLGLIPQPRLAGS